MVSALRHGPFAHGSHVSSPPAKNLKEGDYVRFVSSPPAKNLKEGDYVRFRHERVETTGTVIKRSGTRIRVQPKDGGATFWKELSELLPLASAVHEVSEALGPVRTDACDDGDDTNLDDIDDGDAAVEVAAQSAQAADAKAVGEAAGERPTEIVRVRGGGCAASKPRAPAEPFIQDLDGPPRSPSLTVEQGAEATPEDVKVAEPVPETTDSAPTKVVEPVARTATEAESAPAEARAETWNPISEIGRSIIKAIELAFTPRGPSSSGPSGSADALSVRNVHQAILKADNSPRQPMIFRTTVDGCALLPPKLPKALSELDTILIDVLLSGAIRLLRVEWLMKQLDDFKMPNRQELEKLEKSGVSPSPLLSGEEAAALVRRGDRSIGALTYGWLSPGDPDPDGSRMRVLRRALMGMAIRIEALFWDFGSLYQNPRSPEQEKTFKIALKGGAMNQLYASILASTVLQIEEIPPRPAEFDGVVCLFKLSSNVDETMVRAALIRFGPIDSCGLSHTPAIVRFASHASAVAAKEVGDAAKDAGVSACPGLCEGLDTLYNETPYFSRGW